MAWNIAWRSTGPNPIAADPNRPYGRIAKMVAIALVHFLNPES
jgi:hypothetical protein